MNRCCRNSGLLMCALYLGGCAVTVPTPAPVEDRTGIATEPTTQRSPAVSAPTPPLALPDAVPEDTGRDQHPAVAALLATAREELLAGRTARAGATLERALRVDAKDPWVWQTLSRVHLSNGDFDQARVTAERSSALAGTMYDVLAANWRLIAQTERRRGNIAASDFARQRAGYYERLIDAGPD